MEQTISIIVPVYNAEKTLERCVRSLLGQTYENLEILLVNDGSRDDSLSLCREYAASDSRIRVIDKPNGGVSSARNAGLDAARGDFVLFCDSDDWVEPDLCESMLEQYRPGDTVICEIDRYDEAETNLKSYTDAPRKEIFHYPLVACSPINKLYLRSAVGDLRFHEGLELGEDVCFVLEYLGRVDGVLRILHRRLYHYDISVDGSLSKRVPSPEQIDTFFHFMDKGLRWLGATDVQTMDVRDNGHINWHFENYLKYTASRSDISLLRKLKIAEETGRLDAYRQCCSSIRQKRNPIYLWCYRRGHVRLVMLYLILQARHNTYTSIRKSET